MGPLRRVLASIAALPEPPSLVLATGDLTDTGHSEEYRRLREIVDAFPIPIYLLPGNHDQRPALREVFDDSAYLHAAGEAVQFAIEAPEMRVLAMDSSEPGRHSRYLDAARLQWLRERLNERPRTPTMLAMHHPPFLTGVRYFDDQPFEGREELADIVRSHAQIRRIACGHVHQLICRTWNGTVGISSPSTAPTIVLHPGRMGVSIETGGFLLHRTTADAAIVTEIVRIPSEPAAVVVAPRSSARDPELQSA